MINLENLMLYLSIIRNNKNYIDGIELYNDILINMPRLNKFTFNVFTYVDKKNDEITFSSNTDIQRSFNRKEYGLWLVHVLKVSQEKVNINVTYIHCHMNSKADATSIRFHINSKLFFI
jgi:hypothetical protein